MLAVLLEYACVPLPFVVNPTNTADDLAESTIANYQANVQLQEFIVLRLTHKSHNVKYKVLVIVKVRKASDERRSAIG